MLQEKGRFEIKNDNNQGKCLTVKIVSCALEAAHMPKHGV